ncbi:MAG: LysR family transcriptional regulator [Aeromicrobium sp.]|jgi:DNA-binding transcriptional LysR family regulator|nr:LysR family transcriptional regulator [Aeromicrobium sp.]
MDLRALKSFVVVARTESVTEAANEILISQPALTRQIQALERELRLTLFDRARGRLTLSAAGRELLPQAMDVLAASARFGSVAGYLAAGRLDRIAISTPATTETDIIAPFVATFGPVDPVPSIIDLAGRRDTDALQAGADMVVGGDPRGQGLERLKLCELPVWAYVPADHGWATRDSISLRELSETTILALNPPFRARQILNDAARDEDLVLGHVVECTGPQIAQALAAAGRGVAVLTDDTRFGLHALRIEGDGRPITVTLMAAWSAQHHAATSLHAVASRLREFCEHRYGVSHHHQS